MVFDVKLSVYPVQMAELLPNVGVAGGGLIVTLVVPAVPVHPVTVAVTEYVPPFTVPTPPMVGFCVVEV